jgi:predicted nucleic acid-binding protein
MKPVFADTGFFLALINPRDQYHRSAAELNSGLSVPLLTTAWVLLEFANAISASRARERFERVLVRLRSESDATIIAPEPDLFDRGCQLYISRPDKEWSLTDCVSFVVMERDGLTDALTGDRHFEQAGFRALLRG